MGAFAYKLERLDGTPADPPSFQTTVLRGTPATTIPLGRTGGFMCSRSRQHELGRPADDDALF
jgi:hypothetical protein